MCVCVCACRASTCVHVCVYVYECVYMLVYVCVYACVNVCVCVFVCVCVQVWLHASVRACMRAWRAAHPNTRCCALPLLLVCIVVTPWLLALGSPGWVLHWGHATVKHWHGIRRVDGTSGG